MIQQAPDVIYNISQKIYIHTIYKLLFCQTFAKTDVIQCKHLTGPGIEPGTPAT